ncbi:MAG: Dyp-type peroxidase [Bryobacterales bacterium]|nr:Dyp-type peroxidase [Bryobacterales bacterium]
MGRWRNGAPLTISDTDDPVLGADPDRNNNFDFAEDADKARCPFAAHIRKTNPRSDFQPQELNVDVARIMRQGIPFGPEVAPDERRQNLSLTERGLMFVCYQTSIVKQFERIQQSWANNPFFVRGNVGFDPIIGNSSDANRNRFIDWPGASAPGLSIPTEFVVATGGLYAFVPSVSALKGLLSHQ